MNNVIIRKATLNDALNLVVLKQQVWIATYATEGIRTEFSNYVLSEFTPEKIKQSILSSSKITFIAEIDNHIVGCVEIDYSTKCESSLITYPEITVLYVLECFCGKGIGKSLLNEAFLELKETGYTGAWLTVYYKNFRAITFYNKIGFKEHGSTFFEMEGNLYENKIMVCSI